MVPKTAVLRHPVRFSFGSPSSLKLEAEFDSTTIWLCI